MAIIWLNEKGFPEYQKCKPFFYSSIPFNKAVVRFKKEYKFDSEIKEIKVKYAADTASYLILNKEEIVHADAKPTGDFLYKDRGNPDKYWNVWKKDNFSSKILEFEAVVYLGNGKLCDLSSGQGGFILEGEVTLSNGETVKLESDESWLCCKDNRYCFDETKYNDFTNYDDRKTPSEWKQSEAKDIKWNITDPDIELPICKGAFKETYKIEPNSQKTIKVELPLIYSAFCYISAKCEGLVTGRTIFYEVKNDVSSSSFAFVKDDSYRIINLLSIGGFKTTIKNKSNKPAYITFDIQHAHYPFNNVGYIKTNNNKLNYLFDKCQFAAINCSQTYLLDSPKHQEPLASCAGDYQIISLVLAASTGDYKLIKHVLKGYSETMVRNGGDNANLSYSLISVIWLWKIYQQTGDKELLEYCLPGIESIYKLFSSFCNEEGLIDHPYNYIFMDWLVVDGFGLFAPPMALGQSVFNMFYYDFLKSASLIYGALGKKSKSSFYKKEQNRSKTAINKYLFDKDRCLYIEGLSTPTPKDYKNKYWDHPIPENPNKIYYRKHANFLAVCVGLLDKKTSRKVIKNTFEQLGDLEIQPYFDFYLLEALRNAGLEKRYTMKVLKEFTNNVKKNDKGLPEGFYKPEPAYIFDYSHAWGCSPYYEFIMSTSGLKILEPGFKKISFSFKSLGLKEFEYKIGTPYGFITVSYKDKQFHYDVPKEIEVIDSKK